MMMGRLVAGTAQAAADGQAIFAGQHQVQHQQVVAFADPELVHGLGVFRRDHIETLLGQIAAQQIAQADVVIHHQHFELIGGCCRISIAVGRIHVAYGSVLAILSKSGLLIHYKLLHTLP
jgi:hypothetical protein